MGVFFKRISTVPVFSLEWLVRYKMSMLPADLLAGMTLAAFTLPEAMAYAGLAGLPLEAGLYAGIFASIAYFILGTSRHLTVGPTSALSILLASGLASFGLTDPAQYASMAAITAIMVAVICFICWFLHLGFLVHFVSEPVLTGFSAGAALYIAMTQLNKLFGIHGGHGEFFERFFYLFNHLGDMHWPSLVLGISAIICLAAGHKYLPKLPVALFVVSASILIMSYTGLGHKGIKVVGQIPQGLPTPSLPPVSLQTVRSLMPLTLAVFLLSYIEGISMARTFSKKHGYEINADQELLALGAANVSSGLFQGYPVGGSLSRSAVNDRAGAQTQLSAAFSAVLLMGVLILFTNLFKNLPETVLSAVVIVAVKGLFNPKELKRLYQVHRVEFWNAIVALVGVLIFGLLKGVLIGSVVSIIIIIRHVVFAKIIPLGRVKGTDHFVDISRYPEAEAIPGVEIYSPSSRLVYANCQSIKKQISGSVQKKAPLPELVIVNLSATAEADIMVVDMFAELYNELQEKGVRFRVANTSWPVRDLFKKIGLEAICCGVDQPLSIPEILSNCQTGDSCLMGNAV